MTRRAVAGDRNCCGQVYRVAINLACRDVKCGLECADWLRVCYCFQRRCGTCLPKANLFHHPAARLSPSYRLRAIAIELGRLFEFVGRNGRDFRGAGRHLPPSITCGQQAKFWIQAVDSLELVPHLPGNPISYFGNNGTDGTIGWIGSIGELNDGIAFGFVRRSVACRR